MNKSFKLFLILTSMYVFAFTQTACTQQDNNPDIQKPKSSLATPDILAESTPSSSVEVYPLAGVGEAVTNKIVDIKFTKDGKEMSLVDYAKGKYVFLNFWGTWCPPCRAEIPHIVEISDEMKNDLIVIGVAMERPTDAASAHKGVAEFAEKNNIKYLNIVLNQGHPQQAKLAQAYGGLQYVPTTFLIDKEGNIFEKIQGGRSKEDFVASLKKMMKK